jgi:hypothetical protein
MHSFKYFLEATKRTGCTCWANYKRVPGTKPCSPGSCVKESITEEVVVEDNKTGDEKYRITVDHHGANKDVPLYTKTYPVRAKSEHEAIGTIRKLVGGRNHRVEHSVAEELSADQQFDLIEEMVTEIAEQYNLDSEMVWEKFEDISDTDLLEAAVDAKGYKSSTGGLTQKGRDAYNRKEGSNLKAPVTTPPSKLKAGSKAANRRKSFCARMSGVEGPMKKPNGEPTRKALALRKWNC